MKELQSLFNKSLITQELEPSLKTWLFNVAHRKAMEVCSNNQSALVLAAYMQDSIQNNWKELNIDIIDLSLDTLLIETLIDYSL